MRRRLSEWCQDHAIPPLLPLLVFVQLLELLLKRITILIPLLILILPWWYYQTLSLAPSRCAFESPNLNAG